MAKQQSIYLAALEHVASAKAAAERVEGFLFDATNRAIAAEQVADDGSFGVDMWFAEQLGGAWDVPFTEANDKLGAAIDRVKKIDVDELREAGAAVGALAHALDLLTVDLEGHIL